MTDGEAPASEVAYTFAEVERYVGAVAEQRAEIELAIVHARTRIALALPLEDRITALERRVSDLMANWSQLSRSAIQPRGAESPDGGQPAVPDYERRHP